nr:DUF4349 domain-containing protein [uncultured Butyrivibrio sp.]
MKKRFGLICVTSVVALSIMLSACGSSKGDSFATSASYAPQEAYDTNGVYDYEAAEFAEEAKMADNSFDQAEQVVDTSRKLITTMNISTETEDLDLVLSGVQNKVKELGGYVESSNIYNGSSYSGRVSNRSASLSLRIPADKLDQFVVTLDEGTNITNKSTNVEDVTLSYVDIESRKKALKAEEARLLEIVESAETVEDIIKVEERLSEVRYQLESIESQLRTYDNKITFSTVYLDITEVTQYTPTEQKGVIERIAEGFVNSCKSVWNAIVEFFVWFVIHIPQIIVLGLVVIVIILLIKKIKHKKSPKTGTTPDNNKNQQNSSK